MKTRAHSIHDGFARWMKPLLRVTAVLAALGATSPLSAQTERWVQIATGQNDQVRIYVDPARMTRTAEGHLRTWVRWDYSRPRTTVEGARYTSELLEYDVDCGNQRTRVRWAAAYDKNDPGRGVLARERGDGSWNTVMPESLGEQELAGICDVAAGLEAPPAAPPAAAGAGTPPAAVAERRESPNRASGESSS